GDRWSTSRKHRAAQDPWRQLRLGLYMLSMSQRGYTSEARLRRTAIENLCLAIADLRVQRKHGRVEIGIGPRLELEVAEGVGAAHESRAVTRTAGLGDARGDVADGGGAGG